ncbi:MAG TPA: hypothetical protein VF230_10050 [Acidimicrobiales bacterium]
MIALLSGWTILAAPSAGGTEPSSAPQLSAEVLDGDVCEFEARIPMPAGESGLLGAIQIDPESCEVTEASWDLLEGAALTAYQNELAADPSDPLATNPSYGTSGSGGGSCFTKRTENNITDPPGIKLTRIHTSLSWCYNFVNGIITSFNGSGGTSHHTETVGPFTNPLGSGWRLLSSSHGVVTGGAGEQYVGTRGEGDWDYKGTFDPSGTLYRNFHGSTIVANTYGAGVWWCELSVRMDHRPALLWTWNPYCGS